MSYVLRHHAFCGVAFLRPIRLTAYPVLCTPGRIRTDTPLRQLILSQSWLPLHHGGLFGPFAHPCVPAPSSRCLIFIQDPFRVVAPPRFERGLPEPKSGVLTFAPRGNCCYLSKWIDSNLHPAISPRVARRASFSASLLLLALIAKSQDEPDFLSV